MITMLEITLHDGPARLGKWNNTLTPSILSTNTVNLVDNLPMAYDVPRELAEWSVEETIQKAHEGNRNNVAVIHGAKYLDLRLKCVQELEKLGYNNFMLANTDQLLKRSRDAVNMLVGLREGMNPNSSLYVPFCDINYIPLLAYLGVDLFGDAICGYYARTEILITPDSKYPLKKYEIYDIGYSELLLYNKNSLDLVVREVKAHIENGTLRNLVEMRCTSSPETMAALKILDREYGDYLLKYTPLY
ncbi:MAG TPA: archaeosine tRNA-ribosyltransferase [Methanobacteriaceae archaeon]|nr:archaeosine tRNA-ribosyltransferase [Methanobacteriaceae archaeon]